jgi:DNA repair exonuclease SbcCD ATPase subunit
MPKMVSKRENFSYLTDLSEKLQTMKKILAFLALASFLGSCLGPGGKAELKELRQKNDSLTTELAEKDSTMKLFEESFTTIQRNLALISEREKSISLRSGDLDTGEDAREEITKDIQAINNLLQENKNTINRLNDKLSDYGSEVAGFQNLIDQLSRDIETKEEEIYYLKENLTAANFTIEILNEMLDSAEFRNEIQADLIQMQSNELNTAYYIIGTFKELSDAGVVEKKGDIIGIAGSKQLKDDFNKDLFVRIDLTRTREISIPSKKPSIVTPHPSETYSLEGDDEKTLKILEPIRFWETSKYLVIIL